MKTQTKHKRLVRLQKLKEHRIKEHKKRKLWFINVIEQE